jgi:hypothetical protein
MRGLGKYILQSVIINNNNNVVKDCYNMAKTRTRNIAILTIVGLSLFILFVFFCFIWNNLSLNSYLYIYIYIYVCVCVYTRTPFQIFVWVVQFRKRSPAIIIYSNSLTAGHNTETHRESVSSRNPCAHNKRNRFRTLVGLIFPRHSLYNVMCSLNTNVLKPSSPVFLFFFFFLWPHKILLNKNREGTPRISQSQEVRILLCLLLCQRVPGDQNDNTQK